MNKKLIPLLMIFFLLAGCALFAPPPLSADEPTAQVESVSSTVGFTLTSPDLGADGRLPIEYTCDGASSTLALNWSGAPAGTQSYAVIMHHVAAPDDIHWYWVLYDIPADVTSLPKNVSGVGTLGNNVNNGLAEYSPPCSQGPGDKTYTYTVYALSAVPQIDLPAEQITRDVMLTAIENIILTSAELNVVYARQGMEDTQAQSQSSSAQQQGGGTPPAEAFAACSGKAENASCEFSDQNGSHTGVCKTTQDSLACAPSRDGQDGQQGGSQPADGAPAYNIEQAISDKAQGMTISYDALAFMTGDLGADSFFPPGKVADFWGFQYLRDNDPSQMGHAGDFLTSAAMNTLNNLTAEQRAELVTLAQSQVSSVSEYGYRRFVLIKAFTRLADGDLPSGTSGLSLDAVKAYSADLYKLDGQISFARAELYGKMINSMSANQIAYFDAMKGEGMMEWPVVTELEDIRGLDREVKVAVMTYAADMYSWYAGSIEADVYFCPERHGTYFGSFYLKDIKAMSDPTYSIPTNLTGDLGETMLGKLTPDQSQLITSLVTTEKTPLQGMVDTREQISVELRKFLSGGAADGREALYAARAEKPDLILLDIMMPEMSGYDFIKAYRKERETPIILLTAKLDETDKVLGLELGADDYVTKPFGMKELVARINAVLRRAGHVTTSPEILSLGGIHLTVESRTVKSFGRPVSLTPSEFDLLHVLMSAPGKVFSRSELLLKLQGTTFEGVERTIDVHIRNLRTKVEPNSSEPIYIKMVFLR